LGLTFLLTPQRLGPRRTFVFFKMRVSLKLLSRTPETFPRFVIKNDSTEPILLTFRSGDCRTNENAIERGEVLQASRRRIEELLWVLGLNKVTSPIWERLRGGQAVRQSRLMRAFYSSLLPEGALVFDIGANVGTMTTIFASLDAKVVAVEPNPDCARHIERTTSRHAVHVLQAAVGERNGLAELEVSDRKDKMSSLSREWREAVSNGNRNYAAMWNRKLTVPMITLDSLVERYELPFYIKIDVEGYEDHVIKGLSSCPPLLSFEFNSMFLEPALRALDNSIFDQASFNYTLIDPVKFERQDWVHRDELKKRILGLQNVAGLGDIFVRNSASK
jgi:FkbM family methyltransferase